MRTSDQSPRKRGRPAKANFQKAFSLPIELWEKVVDKLEREKGLGVEHGVEIPIGTQSDLIIELLTRWLCEPDPTGTRPVQGGEKE